MEKRILMSKLQSWVTKKKRKFGESSPLSLKLIRSGWRKNGGRPKQKWKHFKSAVFERAT